MLVSDIVTRAFRKINVESEDETMQPERMQRGVEAFNMMVHAWKLAGVDLEHTDLAATDVFPYDPEYQEGFVYLLASRLSPDYMVPANFDADDWFRKFQAANAVIEPLTMPAELQIMPSQFRRYRGWL